MDGIEDHEKNCLMGIVECRFQRCFKKMKLDMLDSHMKSCPYRPLECPLCEDLIQPSEWSTAHPGCFSDNMNIVRINGIDLYHSGIEVIKYVLLGEENSHQAFLSLLLGNLGGPKKKCL